MFSKSLRVEQYKTIAKQLERDMKCGFVSEVNVSNRVYLSKFKSSDFEEFLGLSEIRDEDKKILKRIFEKGNQVVETFDQMMMKSLDFDQFRAVCDNKLKDTSQLLGMPNCQTDEEKRLLEQIYKDLKIIRPN